MEWKHNEIKKKLQITCDKIKKKLKQNSKFVKSSRKFIKFENWIDFKTNIAIIKKLKYRAFQKYLQILKL
jgi:hypothetical protein